MQIKSLFNGVEALNDISSILHTEIINISFDTNSNLKKSLFFCLKGTNTDGHNFLEEAKQKGALIAVVENINKNVDIPQILVKDSREVFSLVCSNFYDNPAKKLKLIGVTGTNGKTSTCVILKNIFSLAGKKVGVIGTLGYYINDKSFNCNLTTPDPIKLQEIFSHFVKENVQYVFMEVSAHAIYYKKIFGLKFEIAVLTNITQDHLEFFKTMENYSKTKMDFINSEQVKLVIANADDSRFSLITKENVISYGINNPSDCFAIDIVLKIGTSEYSINALDNVLHVKTNLSGIFNVYNVLASVAVALVLGIDLKTIVKSLNSMSDINGRFNVISTKKGEVILDFAHTPDGLENILKSVKMASFKNIICVFGCNGNRDRLKRPIMGKIAQEYCHKVFLTSDNPRYENPMLIAKDILEGISQKNKFITQPDRQKAILLAMDELCEDSIVVICGKGGEKYQDINGVNVPYEDINEIEKAIEILNIKRE